jgi:hypothetical protein
MGYKNFPRAPFLLFLTEQGFAIRICRRRALTWLPNPAIKVDVMEVRFMASLSLHFGVAQFTTAIVRMLGKAVKFRHCPATVSAPA